MTSDFVSYIKDNYVILLSIPILFLIGFSCGSIPIMFKLTPKNKRKFGIANAFSGGIFLGAGMLHMLPDANDGFSDVTSSDYPIANAIASIGFIFTLFLELILSPGHEAIIETIKDGNKKHKHKHSIISDKPNNAQSRIKEMFTRPQPISKIKKINKMNKNDINTPIFRSDSPQPFPYSINDFSPNSKSFTNVNSPTFSKFDLNKQKFDNNDNNNVVNPNSLSLQAMNNEINTNNNKNNNDSQYMSPLLSQNNMITLSTPKNNKKRSKSVDNNCNDDCGVVRVRYYSRLFESGFNAAIMLSKQMGSKNVPRLIFDEPEIINPTNNEIIQQHSNTNNPSVISAFIFLVVLSIHSIITGLAVGGNDNNKLEQWYLLFALVVHKACASMALGISIKKARFSKKFSIGLIAGFAVTTPFGVAIGLGLNSLLQGNLHDIVIASATAFGAGTFLYLSTMENIVEEFVESQTDLVFKWFALFFGMIIMGILAIFS